MEYTLRYKAELKQSNKKAPKKFVIAEEKFDTLESFMYAMMEQYEAPRVNGYKYVGRIVEFTDDALTIFIDTVLTVELNKKSSD